MQPNGLKDPAQPIRPDYKHSDCQPLLIEEGRHVQDGNHRKGKNSHDETALCQRVNGGFFRHVCFISLSYLSRHSSAAI